MPSRLDRAVGDLSIRRKLIVITTVTSSLALALLERGGHEAVVAETGRQALELHARGNIDLRGAAGNFNAAGTVAIASELEQIGRSGDLSNAAAVFTRLEAEASRLVTALRAFGGPETCAS